MTLVLQKHKSTQSLVEEQAAGNRHLVNLFKEEEQAAGAGRLVNSVKEEEQAAGARRLVNSL